LFVYVVILLKIVLKNEYLHAIIMYEFWKKELLMLYVKSICNAFGEVTVSIQTCKRWYYIVKDGINFKRGDFDIENDKSRSGQSIDDDSIRIIVAANPQISTKEFVKSITLIIQSPIAD